MSAKEKKRGRRQFMKEGAALAGFAVGGGVIRAASGQTLGSETPAGRPKDTRAYSERSRFETASRWAIKGDW